MYKKIFQTLATATGFLITVGCVHTQAVQLGQNTHRIEARSGGLIDATETEDRALLKAAELTLDAGHRWFIIDNVVDKSKTATISTPETTVTTQNAAVSPFLGIAVAASNSTTKTYEATTSTVTTEIGFDSTIRTFAEKPSDDARDAREIAKYYGPRLNPLRWGFETPSTKLPPLKNP